MRTYKVVAIAQVYNEIENKNLYRFFEYIKPIVEHCVIYDDCSTDGSFEYAKTQTPFVIRGEKNDFENEINHRQLLLAEALKLQPDYILQMDADEVLSAGSDIILQELCQYCEDNKLDGLDIHLENLWRSSSWKRVDSLFNDGWFTRLWKVTSDLEFKNTQRGLHQRLVPESVKKTERHDRLKILHYGFASQRNLAYKYLIYKSHGQRGYIMLDRLINEDVMELEQVDRNLIPLGLQVEETMPEKIPYIDALAYVNQLKDEVFRPKYSIACLIYKSIEWLKFVHLQVLKYTDMKDVEFFFVANDASNEVLEYLKNNHIPHYELSNSDAHKKEWYINNVYRAYNYAAKVARGDFLILINSDMCFSPGWLEALKNKYTGDNLIASRLVESGKLRTGQYGIEKNFGYSLSEYKENEFLLFAESIKKKAANNGGLFMPLLVKKSHFEQVGGYPEGNLKLGADIFSSETALPGEAQIAGDVVLMQRMESIGVTHQTSMDSIVYHFQCGEKDDAATSSNQAKDMEIAICNDICIGSMGEKVLWNYLLDNIEGTYPVDTNVVGSNAFEARAKDYIEKQHNATSIIIQNATFIDTIDPHRFTIAFLQDDLRSMGKGSSQQELSLKLAQVLVTNSIQTSLSYPEYDFHIVPVGINADLFYPQDKVALRHKYGFGDEVIGIFVGSFSEVKGWSKVVSCFKEYKNITWIAVSKYDEKFEMENVHVFNKINQEKLAELLNCADFFIIGSPVETQCLAAVEANLCNIPVVMPLVGIYKDFTSAERDSVGLFDDNLIQSVAKITSRKYSPRAIIINKGLTVNASIQKWRKIVEEAAQQVIINRLQNKSPSNELDGLRLNFIKLTLSFRTFLINKILGDKYWSLVDLFTRKGFKKFVRELLLTFGLLNQVKRFLTIFK